MPGSVPPPTSHVSRTAQRGHSFRAKSRTERSGLGRLPAGPVSSEDIRRAIFQTLTGPDPYEVVDGTDQLPERCTAETRK